MGAPPSHSQSFSGILRRSQSIVRLIGVLGLVDLSTYRTTQKKDDPFKSSSLAVRRGLEWRSHRADTTKKKSAGRSPSNKSLSYRLNPSYVRVPLPNVSRRQNLAERGVLEKMLLSFKLNATYTQKRKPLKKSGFCRLVMLRCVGDSNP